MKGTFVKSTFLTEKFIKKRINDQVEYIDSLKAQAKEIWHTLELPKSYLLIPTQAEKYNRLLDLYWSAYHQLQRFKILKQNCKHY